MKNTKKKCPNVLVIANNSLSNNNSNGRTLSCLLEGWDKEKIAQFYITAEMPESTVCEKFYQVTDKEVLKNFIKPWKNGKELNNHRSSTHVQKKENVMKKSVFTLFVRNIVWNCGGWYNKRLKKWLNNFSPEIIIFFAGDSAFMYNIAMRIAKDYEIPIIMYNCESYYFKEKNYLINSRFSRVMYPLLHYSLKKTFKRIMKKISYVIYANDKLKDDYNKIFNCPSSVIYNSATIDVHKSNILQSDSVKNISYLGNLGLNRHKSLCEIGKALYEINPNLCIDVYGKITDENIKNAFDECKGIKYNGVVSYDEVVRITKESDLLIHAESFEKFYCEDLQYAFSTKIADCLASGVCLVLYAPNILACTQYLKKYDCAYVIDKPEFLIDGLREIVLNKKKREEYAMRGIKVAGMKHNISENKQKMFQIIDRVVKGEKK